MNVANVLPWHTLAGLVILACALCNETNPPVWAGKLNPPPGLAVAAEPVVGKHCQFLRLYLENTTEKPVEIVDLYCPAFTVDTWFHFSVNGKAVDATVLGSHSLGADEKKVVPAKAKLYIGNAILREFKATNQDGYTPRLKLQPGKHMLDISSKKNVKPLELNVTVPDQPPPGKADPEKEPPLLLSLTQAHVKYSRNALFIHIHLLNRTDQQFEIPHGGLEPPWHTAEWFDLEINGKAFKPRVPPVEFPGEKGNMEIRPLEHRYRGELMIPLAGWDREFYEKNNYFTPKLALPVGKYTIRVLPSQRWSQPGFTPPAPAALDFVVPPA